MSERLKLEIRDGIASLTLDDGKANALSPAMIEDILQALDTVESEAKLLVIRGRAGIFCAGFDLRLIESDVDAALGMVALGGELLMRLYQFPLPVVIVSTGHAIAAGAVLLLAADHRIAADGPYKVQLNEVANGLSLPGYAIEMLRDRISPQALTPSVLCSAIFDPASAVSAGYYDEVIKPDALQGRLDAVIEQLKQLDLAAFAETKRRIRGEISARIADQAPFQINR